MANIEIINASQEAPEAPVKIQVSSGNIYYQGPKGDTPVKGVDYFTPADIAEVLAQVPEVDLTPYATKTEVAAVASNAASNYATKTEMSAAIQNATFGSLKRQVVQTLPVSNIDSNTIYMVAKTGDTGDVYDEYIYTNNNWELIGNTAVDLTGYATEAYVDERVANVKTKYTILLQQTYAASDTYNILDLPVGLKNKLWNWLSNASYSDWSVCPFSAFNEGQEDFEVIVKFADWRDIENITSTRKVKYIHAQYTYNGIAGWWDFVFGSSDYRTIFGEPNGGLSGFGYFQIASIAVPTDNDSWSTTARGVGSPINYVDGRYVVLAPGVDYNGVRYRYLTAAMGVKQNKLTAGSGIIISNDTISAAGTEYLTNSDILAIWNGTNDL